MGLTTDLENILIKHKEKRMLSFKANFSFDRLLYVEEIFDVNKAIERSDELKKAPRLIKQSLLKNVNPKWECLSGQWQASS